MSAINRVWESAEAQKEKQEMDAYLEAAKADFDHQLHANIYGAQAQGMQSSAAMHQLANSAYQNHYAQILGRQPKVPSPPFNPNEVPALMVSLETFRDLWAAKYGSQWVEASAALMDDEYWVQAYQRLDNNYLLESCRGWYRLKE